MGLNRAGKVTEKKSKPNSTLLPWKLNYKEDIGKGKPAYFAVLHDLSVLWQTSDDEKDNGNLATHFVKGVIKSPICNHLYFDDEDPKSVCEFCEMPGSFKDQEFNEPYLVKPLLVVCLNLIDQKKTSKDGTKEYDCNPVKILETKYANNFEDIEYYHNHGALSIYDDPSSIFIVEQELKADGSVKKYTKPTVLAPIKLKELGKQFKTDIKKALPEVWEKFHPDNITPEQIRGLILEQYSNIKRDHKLWTKDVKVEWPAVEEKKEEVEESSDDEEDNIDND